MNVPANIKARVKAKLEESIATAEAHFGTTFQMPSIRYDKRGTTAGVATCNRNEVNFNATLLMENVEDFLGRTVPHEMAHLIDYKLHPENFQSTVRVTRGGRYKRTKRDIHGATWKNIMRVLGAPTSRCHSYDTTNSKVKKAPRAKHDYTCNQCGKHMHLGPQRHRKQQAGLSSFTLKVCRGHRTAGYTYQGLVRSQVEPVAAQAPNPPKAPRAQAAGPHSGKSKLQICRELYDWTESRQWNINQFVVGAGCTSSGAATYYAKIKKGA